MKHTTSIILAILTFTLGAFAADLRLAWNPSVTPGVTNYVLYVSTNALTTANMTNAPVKLNCGTNLAVRVEGLAVGNWSFGVTCVKSNVQSDLSNIVPAEVPAPPANMRTVVLQYTDSLQNGWSDVGLFRVRIE